MASLQGSHVFCLQSSISVWTQRLGSNNGMGSMICKSVNRPFLSSTALEMKSERASSKIEVSTVSPAEDLSEEKAVEFFGYSKNMAFQSVRQERWEGELQVDGEIPNWLVSMFSIK